MGDELHDRLNQEHTDALLKNYSADYETWLEDRIAELEEELEERTQQYHLAHAKILSREAIIEQLSESELGKDVTKLEADNKDIRESNHTLYLRCQILEEENERLGGTVGFFASCIKSGELWTDTCQEHMDALKGSG